MRKTFSRRISRRRKPVPRKSVLTRRNLNLSLAERKAVTRAKRIVREARRFALKEGFIGEEYSDQIIGEALAGETLKGLKFPENVVVAEIKFNPDVRVRTRKLKEFERKIIKQTISKEQKKFAENKQKIVKLNPELQILYSQEETQLNSLGRKMQLRVSRERGTKMALKHYSAIRRISTSQLALLEGIEVNARKKLTPELLETLKEMQLAARRNFRATKMLSDAHIEK